MQQEDMRERAESILAQLLALQERIELVAGLPRLTNVELSFSEDERGVSSHFAYSAEQPIGDPGTVSVDCYQTVVNKAGIVGILNQQSHDIEIE